MVIIRRVSQMKSMAKWSFRRRGYLEKMVLDSGFSMWLSTATTPFCFIILVSTNSRDRTSE